MSGAFKDHFSGVASGYRAFRPRYPAALFAWLAEVAPSRALAVDIGCGNGQATVALAGEFEAVVGIDPSAEQIANAEPHRRVRYRVAAAEATGLDGGSADAVLVAQALHWLDLDRFYPEVRRVARPGAAFAAVTYALAQIDPAVDAVLGHLYHDVVGPDWPPERRHTESGYRTLPMPFPPLEPPAIAMEDDWTLDQLIGYLRTWSAVTRHRARTGQDGVALVEPRLREAWGAAPARRVRWPIAIRAGGVV
ncbi:MAG TPA: class I SAM-dependent methyltransferase [Anaeromyxobacteraceae bacterium]|nr:class I SAM-dependent methyltransferase [Anaeromyxobacteraceae bacterium]